MSKSELKFEVSQRNMWCPQEPTGQLRKMGSLALGYNRAYLISWVLHWDWYIFKKSKSFWLLELSFHLNSTAWIIVEINAQVWNNHMLHFMGLVTFCNDITHLPVSRLCVVFWVEDIILLGWYDMLLSQFNSLTIHGCRFDLHCDFHLFTLST